MVVAVAAALVAFAVVVALVRHAILGDRSGSRSGPVQVEVDEMIAAPASASHTASPGCSSRSPLSRSACPRTPTAADIQQRSDPH